MVRFGIAIMIDLSHPYEYVVWRFLEVYLVHFASILYVLFRHFVFASDRLHHRNLPSSLNDTDMIVDFWNRCKQYMRYLLYPFITGFPKNSSLLLVGDDSFV